MSRVLTLVGGIAAVGLAIGTAGWKCPPVASGHGDSHRRGRLEFRHDDPHAALAAALAGALPRQPGPTDPAVVDPTPDPEPATQPEVATQPETAAQPEPQPEPPAEPDLVTIDDLDLCQIDEGELPMFRVLSAVRIHADPEGILYFVSATTRKELNSQRSVLASLGRYSGRPFIVVPDRMTNWKYVKETLDSADSASTREVYLGVASPDDKTTLRILRIHPTRPADEPADGDFVIGLREGDTGAAEITIDGEVLESFPIDLAMAWNEWKKANADRSTSSVIETPVVVEIHKFTPMSLVLPVLGVLRGLGIETERLVGDTGYAGRKNR